MGLRATIGLVLVMPLVGQSGQLARPELTAQEQKLLDLTNRERKKKELAPVQAQAALMKAARLHAENMARQGKMEHVLDGKDQYERIQAAGYQFGRAGENLAYLDPDDKLTLDDLMQAWMDSKEHRTNILTADFTDVGIGIAKDKKGRIYFAQVFARPLKIQK